MSSPSKWVVNGRAVPAARGRGFRLTGGDEPSVSRLGGNRPRFPAARCRRRRRPRAPGRGGPSPTSSPRPPNGPARPGPGCTGRHRRRVRVPRNRAIARRSRGMQSMPGTQHDLGVSGAFDPSRTSTLASPTCAASPTSSGPCSHWPPTTPGPAPCGATTASRHAHRRGPTWPRRSRPRRTRLPAHRTVHLVPDRHEGQHLKPQPLPP